MYKVEQRCGLIEGRSEKLKDQLERQESELKNQLGNAQASLQAKLDTQALRISWVQSAIPFPRQGQHWAHSRPTLRPHTMGSV